MVKQPISTQSLYLGLQAIQFSQQIIGTRNSKKQRSERSRENRETEVCLIGGELSKHEGCSSAGGRSVQSETIDYNSFTKL